MVVIRKRTDKKEPDTIETVKRIVRAGTHPLEKDRAVLIRLLPCPYWRTDVCPLRYKFGVPVEELGIEVYKETLRYPIRCKLASYFKCYYVKPYYYIPVRVGDINEWSRGLEDEYYPI